MYNYIDKSSEILKNNLTTTWVCQTWGEGKTYYVKEDSKPVTCSTGKMLHRALLNTTA